MSFVSSSWCHVLAMAFACDIPWTFHLTFYLPINKFRVIAVVNAVNAMIKMKVSLLHILHETHPLEVVQLHRIRDMQETS